MQLKKPNRKALEKAISKTIAAFMNSEGWILFIGIDDQGNVLGLENDYQLLNKRNFDGFEQEIRQSIDKYLKKIIANEYIEIRIHNQNEKEFCEINIAPMP